MHFCSSLFLVLSPLGGMVTLGLHGDTQIQYTVPSPLRGMVTLIQSEPFHYIVQIVLSPLGGMETLINKVVP